MPSHKKRKCSNMLLDTNESEVTHVRIVYYTGNGAEHTNTFTLSEFASLIRSLYSKEVKYLSDYDLVEWAGAEWI